MKVADLTIDELKDLIGNVFDEKIRKLVDPDHGLELREDFIKDLKASAASKKRIPFSEVKKRLGLS